MKWIVDTNAGLASHDRITRMSYYHVRQDTELNATPCRAWPNPWDTALVTACGKRRLAWYTWCLAARQKDAACYDASPSAASWSSSRLDVLWRGNTDDTAIYRRSWNKARRGRAPPRSEALPSSAQRWSPPRLTASMSIPAALTTSTYYRRYNGSTWTSWTYLAGMSYSSRAASARRGTSIVDVFVRGTDNAVYHRYRNGNTWSSALGAARRAAGRRDLSAGLDLERDRKDRPLRARRRLGHLAEGRGRGSWSAWTNIGGVSTSAPAVASRGHEQDRRVLPGHGRPDLPAHQQRRRLDWVRLDRRRGALGASRGCRGFEPPRPLDSLYRTTRCSTRSGSRRPAGPAGATAGSRAPSRAGSPRTTRRGRGRRPRTRASPARRRASGRCRAPRAPRATA